MKDPNYARTLVIAAAALTLAGCPDNVATLPTERDPSPGTDDSSSSAGTGEPTTSTTATTDPRGEDMRRDNISFVDRGSHGKLRATTVAVRSMDLGAGVASERSDDLRKEPRRVRRGIPLAKQDPGCNDTRPMPNPKSERTVVLQSSIAESDVPVAVSDRERVAVRDEASDALAPDTTPTKGTKLPLPIIPISTPPPPRK